MKNQKNDFVKMPFLLLLLLTAVFITAFPAEAAVREALSSVEGSDYKLIAVDGKFTSATKDEILERINAIRKEACQEGVPNPDSSTGEPLTMDDYSEVKWSYALEQIAMQRAAEGAVCMDHTRPNGRSCFSVSYENVSSSAETLAWGSTTPVGGINQWYSEKEDWVNQNENAVTGHYTSMISPSLTYVGISTFVSSGFWATTAGEYRYSGSGLDETKSTVTSVSQQIQVLKDDLSSAELSGTGSLYVGETTNLAFNYTYTTTDYWGYTDSCTVSSAYTVTYESSDTSVATVSSSGTVTAQKVGTAKITATSEDGDSASITITVNPPKKGTALTDGKSTYTVTTAGEEVAFTKTTSTSSSISIPGTVTIGGVTYKVTSVSASALKGNTKVTTVKIPSSVTTIGAKAFYGCKKLSAVTGCAGITSVGSKAFYKCTKLTRVGSKSGVITLKKVKTIGASAFYGCKAIKKVNLTSTVLTTIDASAFRGCTAMTSFVSKSTKLASIGKAAFYGDKNLATVTLKTSKLTKSKMGSNAFKGIKSTCTFKVPSKKVSSYKKIFQAKGAGSRITVKKG